MTDWRDIVGMIETFAQVYHVRHLKSCSDVPLPLVPTALNPPLVRRAPQNEAQTPSLQRHERNGGYSGDLARDAVFGKQGRDSPGLSTIPSERSWLDVWPHVDK
jgi:hypothetical protein